MSSRDPRPAWRRYRRDYLKLRSVLHDRATSLPAYPMLLDRVRHLLDDRRRLGVLHLSVGNLETVESLYGWQVFDGILARAASVLRGLAQESFPAGTLLGVDRVAGEEFVVFVPAKFDGTEVDEHFLATLGRQFLARLEGEFASEEFASLSPRLRFRAGHALLSMDPFYRFERRVYAAVEEARTRDERRRSRSRRSRGEELRQIIRNSAVRMLFQPVVDLRTRGIVGYEALARGPENSAFEMPHAMFSLSSQFGVALDLDRLCRRAAMRESSAVRGRGQLFVNVHPASLDDPEWSYGEPPQRIGAEGWNLVLEVSERGADRDAEGFARSLARLKDLGFRLALDDVGTGYGSLANLERVRPDYLKVDATLVRDIHRHLIKQEVCLSVVQIAERIGASVIAEGVESEDELSALRRAGARLGQGYLFAGPSPAAMAGAPEKPETDH